jgi:hypothetical protein
MSRNRDALAHVSTTSAGSYQAALGKVRSARNDQHRRPTFVIACASRYGGEGKTIVTANLAAALAQDGSHVLAIDCDRQADLWMSLAGQQPASPQLSRSKPWALADDLTGTGRLAVARAPIDGVNGRDEIRQLRNVLRAAGGRFDLVLLDSPPHHAETVAREADALLVPVALRRQFWTEPLSPGHEAMYDWLDAMFENWLEDHEDEDSSDDDGWYDVQRSAFLASVEAKTTAGWPGLWPQQRAAWIERDDDGVGSTGWNPTPDELILDFADRVPFAKPFAQAGADNAWPKLLGLVLNRRLPTQSPAHPVFADLTAEGVPVFRTWISQSDELAADMGWRSIVVAQPDAPAAREFHLLAEELRRCLSK